MPTLIAIVTCLVLTSQPAGTTPDPLVVGTLFDLPIVELTIQAPESLDKEEIQTTLELRIGAILERRTLRRAVKRLFVIGQLSDVQVWAKRKGQGVAIRVVLIPAQVVTEIEVLGTDYVSSDIIRSEVGVRVGDRLDGIDTEELAERIRLVYARRGFPSAQIQVSASEYSNGRETTLLVQVTEGAPTIVHGLSIEADSSTAQSDVKEWTEVRVGDIYDAERITAALQELQRRDRSKGYLDVLFQDPQVQPIDDNSVDVVLTYTRGPRYHVSFRGVRVIPTANLRQLVQFEPEEAFDQDTLMRWAALIVTKYRRAGYPSVKVQAGIGPGPRPGTRRIIFLVEEGQRAQLDQVSVSGASGVAPKILAETALDTVAESSEETSALSYIDRGDLATLFGKPPGRSRRYSGVEYPAGWLSSAPPDLVYDEEAYREATVALEDLYTSEGFLSAQVRGPRPHWSNDSRNISAVYEVTEGVRTKIRSIRFMGNRQKASNRLLQTIEFEPGGPLDLVLVEEARLHLLRFYADRGFAFTRVFDEISYSKDRTQAELTYRIVEGPEVNIGRILVQGNERTVAAVILDRLLLKQGDTYSLQMLERSRHRLLGLGLFTSVSLTLIEPEIPEATKDLLVDVRERKPRRLELNVGASVEDGPRLAFLSEHRNLLGLGVGVRGRIKANYPRLTYFTINNPAIRENLESRFDTEYPNLDSNVRSIFFAEGQALLTVEYPKMFGIPIDTSGRSTLVILRENRYSFTLNKIGLQLGADMRPLRQLTLGSGVELEGTDFICYANVFSGPYGTCGQDESGLTRRQDNGRLGQITFRQEAVFDRRDNPFRPHSGFHLSAVADLALGGGELYGEYALGRRQVKESVTSNFVKVTSSASGYLPLTSSLTLALQGRVGNIFGLSDSEHVPLYKKYFLGGTGSIRGFDEDRVHPADQVQRQSRKLDAETRSPAEVREVLNGSSSGGRFFWNLRSELRFPVTGDVDLGIFVDAGELIEDVQDADLALFSAGGGVGARWNTPVGPIALDLGLALKDPAQGLRETMGSTDQGIDMEERTKVHLSIGYF